MMMLEGLKVIEMSTYVAAPGAGGMLRDWGAEVIKVEPLTGCPMRSFFEGTKSKLEIIGNPIFSLDNMLPIRYVFPPHSLDHFSVPYRSKCCRYM